MTLNQSHQKGSFTITHLSHKMNQLMFAYRVCVCVCVLVPARVNFLLYFLANEITKNRHEEEDKANARDKQGVGKKEKEQ